MNSNEASAWEKKLPLIKQIRAKKEVLWVNPLLESAQSGLLKTGITREAVLDASNRLKRFAPYIEHVFPETKEANGMIESPLTAIPSMQQALMNEYDMPFSGQLLLKQDNALPISGSIKARGGIYEILKHAETLAIENGLIGIEDNYVQFADADFKNFFAQQKIAVGSTGNLGLSIGIMSAKLGFNVTVHMSSDAKQWKKDLLRDKGVTVIEYADDYSKAVEEGRRQAEADSTCHFVDDENSLDLFLGYAVAGERLAAQLEERGTHVDTEHPLFVYLPCGVGGGPGGVAFGLKLAFGDAVHCFFAEPTHSPCMLLGMMTGLHDNVSVKDFGLDNKTAADGLAVGTASGFVGKTMEPLVTGCYTIADKTMFKLLKLIADTEEIQLEPSALAGMTGPIHTIRKQSGQADSVHATHIVWGTGGSMVPEGEMDLYYGMGVSAMETGE